MKKLIFALVFLFTISLSAQITVHRIIADSISNDISKYGYLDLDQFAPNQIDNIYVTLYSSGEVDIDSIGVYGGVVTTYYYQGAEIETRAYESTAIAVESTVTTNLADGVAGIDAGVPILTEALMLGYNTLKFQGQSIFVNFGKLPLIYQWKLAQLPSS